MPEKYKSLLLPGIMAMSMVFTGIWAVAMPLIAEFQFTREIEDRLLAPMEIAWVAMEKVVAGMMQALDRGPGRDSAGVAGHGPGRRHQHSSQPADFRRDHACWWRCFSAGGGLALGCSMDQTQIGLMFSMVLAPMIMFGCTYYPWSALNTFPDAAEGRADQSAGLCQRRTARHAGAAVPAPVSNRSPDRPDVPLISCCSWQACTSFTKKPSARVRNSRKTSLLRVHEDPSDQI